MNNLEQKLWKCANDLRGQMDSSEFKNYMLGFMFLKYLGTKVEKEADELLKNEGMDVLYRDLEDEEILDAILAELRVLNGYHIRPTYLYSNFIRKISSGETIIEHLSLAIKDIVVSSEGENSEEDFNGLFDDIDLTNNKLGGSFAEKNSLISKIMTSIDDIKELTTDVDVLGNAYEYLLKQFASSAGKKGGEFYTPSEVSDVVAKLVATGKKEVKTIYDPTCGSGSLLLKAANQFDKYSFVKGQELNVTTFNLARMNMFLHGISYSKFEIKQGNTLTNDKFMDEKFDAVVANPPFGVNWDADASLLTKDSRFKKYGKLAPKSKGEFAFLQHMLYHLNDDGIMASVVPHGVLFRGAAEGHIRKYMIEQDNVLDAVIGLPANLFYGTGIPACILVFKKSRVNMDDILFIDASKDFEKIKTQNVLREEDISKIIDTYVNRVEIEKYSRVVKIDEIIENEYNLNIPRYVDTFEEEEPIDIVAVENNLKTIKQEMEAKELEITAMLKELGLK